jgi:hypothetical protein
MDNINSIKGWRAEEIVKVFLLKSKYKMTIETSPTPIFDFFIHLKDNPKVKFAIEVKLSTNFSTAYKKLLTNLKIYQEAGMINIPVLIFKIDEVKETGEFDFIVTPSINEKKLMVNSNINLQVLSNTTFADKIELIKSWYSNS